MRIARLEISASLVLTLVREGTPARCVCTEGIIPADCRLVEARADLARGLLVLTLESARFAEVADGGRIPTLPEPMFTLLD
jgi:hypothetical protein